jgi:hypothetical protein
MGKKKMDGEERLDRARNDLKRMQKEIAPFVKERDRQKHSTAGRWRDTRTTAAQHSAAQARG